MSEPEITVRRGGRRLRRGIALLLAAAAAVSVALLARRPPEDSETAVPQPDRAGSPQRYPFADIASRVGMRHPSVCGSPGLIYIFENIGSGAALFDFDGDGRLDAFMNNAGTTEVEDGPPKRVRLVPGPGAVLYRQLPDGRFEDVTDRAGVAFEGWGTGVAVGDVENDGDPDLFVGAFGTSRLYVNNGDGTFSENSRAAGLDRSGYASSAAFVDYDKDGDLDLYVVNYLFFDLDNPPNGGEPCLAQHVEISCPPTMHTPMPDVLYRNRGDGTYEDVTASAGLENQPGAYGLGVAVGDLDRDGWPDIYVTNDTQANFLWRNRGGSTFEEVALFRGVALSENGQGQSGMGVDFGDADRDGWLDIQVNNFSEEPCAYYRNLGDGTFSDETARSGLLQPTFMALSWGSKFFDHDHDGNLDLAIVSGHVQAFAADLGPDQSFQQRIQVFRGEGEGRFKEIGGELGGPLAERRNHRGLAAGDVDGDGDLDLVVTLLDGPPLLLENNIPGANRSVAFLLEGTRSNREGIGARVEMSAGGVTQIREVTRSGSYLSSNDVMVHFGVGELERLESVEIRWPSGVVTTLSGLRTGRLYLVRESDGSAEVIRTFGSEI